jgi:tyrosine decarboxylase / aspartate 1-decarboxylase
MYKAIQTGIGSSVEDVIGEDKLQKTMPEDIALRLLAEALPQLEASFRHLPAQAGPAPAIHAMARVLNQVMERMADNYPYFHPLYAGQMLKPPHPLARAAYTLAMTINPNNHALDGGRASSRMEVEAVREIARMFGWTDHLGHLTSGGTVANLEALWVAGQLAPGKRIVASEQAHYTHGRISAVLGLPFTSVTTDSAGRMDVVALESLLRKGEVGAVVVTLGTTATGAVDPLDKVLALRSTYPFRIHVDAAYGGYFTLVPSLGEEATRSFVHVAEADSIVVDPHKHGLQPYGCGCILFRDPAVGRFYKHDSPYTYFTSSDLHLGEISLECSRAGAAAVALWATQQLLPLISGGEFASGLRRSREAAVLLHKKISADSRFLSPFPPELDILVWAVRGDTVAASSRLAQQIFTAAASQNLHLAVAQLPSRFFPSGSWPDQHQQRSVTCLRSVLMKPEHLDWLDAIWSRLSQVTDEVRAMPAAKHTHATQAR